MQTQSLKYTAKDYHDLLVFSARAQRLDAAAKAIRGDLARVSALEAAESLPWHRRAVAKFFNKVAMKGTYDPKTRCLLYPIGPTAMTQVVNTEYLDGVIAIERMAEARVRTACDASDVNRKVSIETRDVSTLRGLIMEGVVCVYIDAPAHTARSGLHLVATKPTASSSAPAAGA